MTLPSIVWKIDTIRFTDPYQLKLQEDMVNSLKKIDDQGFSFMHKSLQTSEKREWLNSRLLQLTNDVDKFLELVKTQDRRGLSVLEAIIETGDYNFIYQILDVSGGYDNHKLISYYHSCLMRMFGFLAQNDFVKQGNEKIRFEQHVDTLEFLKKYDISKVLSDRDNFLQLLPVALTENNYYYIPELVSFHNKFPFL